MASSASQTLIWNGAPDEVQPRPFAAEGRLDPGPQRLRVLHDLRPGPARPQVRAHRGLALLGREPQPAEPVLRPHRHRRPEGRLEDPRPDHQPLAALARKLPGVIASQRTNRSWSRDGPDSPTSLRDLQHRPPVAQQRLGVPEREVLLVALGRDPRPGREEPLEMRGAHAHRARELLERERRLRPVDQVDRAAHHRVMVAALVHGRYPSVTPGP